MASKVQSFARLAQEPKTLCLKPCIIGLSVVLKQCRDYGETEGVDKGKVISQDYETLR